MLSKSQLLLEMEKASSEKNGDVKKEILQKQVDAFYNDPDEVVHYVADDKGNTVEKKASDIVLHSIKDAFGQEVAVITADGIERGTTVPQYITDMVDSLMIELTETGLVEKTITEYLMLAFLEGRNLK